jgi:prepilin-type processing-associated H-X9-DG protein
VELLVVVGVIALLLSILTPSLVRARHSGRSAVCLSNLRQFAAAALTYTQGHGERFPIAQYMVSRSEQRIWYKWDFTTVQDRVQRRYLTRPGLLWGGPVDGEVHQCPSFRGAANAAGGSQTSGGAPTEKYTGYNYNTSYIGHGQGERPREEPAALKDVRRPPECALFGDGEYASGANKFMRAPWDDPSSGGDLFDGRSAGTQGYRHMGRTNVAWCDGHAAFLRERHTETDQGEQQMIGAGTGFLSRDNRFYDLK